MATWQGELVPGGPHGGDQFGTPWRGWPRPWALRCDDCGRDLPYRCVIGGNERRHDVDEARHLGGDRHRCGFCEGATEQLGMGLA